MRLIGPAIALVLLFSAAFAVAESNVNKSLNPSNQQKGLTFSLDGYAGIGQIHQDLYTTLAVTGSLHWKKLGFGLRVPLRIKIKDYGPKSQAGTLRPEDWDEVSDFFRLVPYLYWGAPNQALYARLGELTDYSLGHGTIVNRYFNSIDLDHYQGGVQAHFFHKYAGGELFLDNIADPNLFGFRAHVRPLSFFFNNFLKNLSIGFSMVVDAKAPMTLRTSADGKPEVSSKNNLQANSQAWVIWGFDIEWAIKTKYLTLTPYLDTNFHKGSGTGVHTGLLIGVEFARGIGLSSKLEYRYQSKNYLADYVNPLYEIERFVYNGVTKQAYLRDPALQGRHGFLLSLGMNVKNWVRFTASYDWAQGANNSNLMLRLDLPGWDRLQFSALYVKRSIDSWSDFKSPDDMLVAAELKVKIVGPLYAFGVYAHRWHVVPEGENRGDYSTTHDYSLGLGARFRW